MKYHEFIATVRDRGEYVSVQHEFSQGLCGELHATEETSRWDASAVLSTMADSISGGELNQVLSQLPAGYAPLFGKPELA
jgi:uncharacterized protein (DUF2267 family)